MTPLATLLLFIPVGFACGSIPMSLLVGKAKGIDIRTVGSKNIGATNLGRALGTRWFLLGFSLDAAKGLAPVFAAGWLAGVLGDPAPDPPLAWAWLGVLAACVLGHMFSPLVGFKGGKGVATSFGAMLGVFPILTFPALAALVVWAAVLLVTRFMGVASCAGAITLPIAAATINAARGHSHAEALPVYAVTAALALLVVIKHRGNLARTLAGTEPKVGSRTTKAESPSTDAPPA